MKRGELERKLKDLGWRFSHSGGRHDAWVHEVKTHTIWVPRHPKIKDGTARQILKDAER